MAGLHVHQSDIERPCFSGELEPSTDRYFLPIGRQTDTAAVEQEKVCGSSEARSGAELKNAGAFLEECRECRSWDLGILC